MPEEPHALGEVIAERGVTFTRADGSTEQVTIRIGKPTTGEFPDEWTCPYQIQGFGRTKTFRAAGVDSIQALLLTLQTILPELDHLAKRESASYCWLEIANAGFPDYRLSPSYQKGQRRGA
jgi:hypothetical protein